MSLSRYRQAAPARAVGAALIVALAACVVAFAPLGTRAQQSVTVVVDGQAMNFDQPPIVQAGRVFVPLRGVFERLGASVVYANGQINATGRGRTVSLTIGSTQATVDGQPATLDVAPFVVGARTMVPLRFIAQSLGAAVNWNDGSSTVTINSGGGRNNGDRGNGDRQYPPAGDVSFSYQWPTGTIYNHFPQIRFQLNRPIQPDDFQVLIDGRSIGGGLQSNGQYYFAAAPWSLPMGNHRVRIQGRTRDGDPVDLSWSFYQASY